MLTGREDFIGNYSFDNIYEHVKYISPDTYDTLRSMKIYTISIDKPSPDNLGSDAVIIRSFWAEYPATSRPVIARVASDGKSLYFKYEDNDGELNMTTFDARLQTVDKSIHFNYFRYSHTASNMGYEKGFGNAYRQ